MRQRKKPLHLSTLLGSIDEKEAVRLKHKGEDGWSFEREFGCLNDKRGAVSTPARTTSEEPIGNSQTGRLSVRPCLSVFNLFQWSIKWQVCNFLSSLLLKGSVRIKIQKKWTDCETSLWELSKSKWISGWWGEPINSWDAESWNKWTRDTFMKGGCSPGPLHQTCCLTN